MNHKIIIKKARLSLINKLKKVDIDSLNISDYNKRYFGSLISSDQSINLHLNKYSYILETCLKNKSYSGNFLDYGAGHGMMCLLAKETRLFSKVIYTDIFDQSAIDANEIAQNLNLQADEYLVGGIEEVKNQLSDLGIKINFLTSYDVLEHIYDMEHFTDELKHIFSNNFSFVLGSGANPLNPVINKKLKDLHNFFEFNQRNKTFGRKPTDTLVPLFEQRKKIITNLLDKKNLNLNEQKISFLSTSSRGLIIKLIHEQIEQYLIDGTLKYIPDHPTNTCDSITGNWFERLMNPFDLKEKFKKSTENVYVGYGKYYSIFSNKNYFPKLILNLIMKILPVKFALFFSGYYLIIGND